MNRKLLILGAVFFSLVLLLQPLANDSNDTLDNPSPPTPETSANQSDVIDNPINNSISETENVSLDFEAANLPAPIAISDLPPFPLNSIPGVNGEQVKRLASTNSAKLAQATIDEIPLLPGWNLISIPQEQVDTDPATVLASIAGNYSRVYAYDNCDTVDPWKLYDPNDLAGSDLTAIDNTMGFWIEMEVEDSLIPNGTITESTDIQICDGWNLIGYPQGTPSTVTGAFLSFTGTYERVFNYSISSDSWGAEDVNAPDWANDLSKMEPGNGYWLLGGAGTISISEVEEPPLATLNAGLDGLIITSPTNISGVIDSASYVEWNLQYRMVNEEQWTTFESGDNVLNNQAVGNFDPTLIYNGIYEVRFIATDIYGQITEETINVLVEGGMKVGLFTISFTDLSVQVAGIPLTLNRTYDSRDKQIGDFGVGWNLDISSGSYANNRPPGDGWKLVRGGLFNLEPCFGAEETKTHFTEIRISDAEFYRFGLKINMYGVGSQVRGACLGDVEFVQTDGLLGAKLDILDDVDVYWTEGTDIVTFSPFSPKFGEPYEPERVLLTTPDGRQFEFTLSGGVESISDLNGNTLTINKNGIVHSSGRSVTITRDSLDRITKITNHVGQTIHYNYDENGDLINHMDIGGNTTEFTYDNNHGLIEIISPLGIIASRNEYDDAGRLIAIIDADGNRVEYDRNIDERQEIVTDRLNGETIYIYDDWGNILSETDPLGNVTSYSYDSNNNLISKTDPLGNTTNYAYDSHNNLLSEIDPLGNTITYTYNDRNRPLTITDGLGNTTSFSYDIGGNLQTLTDPLGNATSYTHDNVGNITSITDPLGNTTRFDFDLYGNIIKETDPLGNEIYYSYDSRGNLISETRARTDSLGNLLTMTTTFVFNDQDQLVQAIDALGNSTFYSYNEIGQRAYVIDGRGNRTDYSYYATGNLAITNFPDGTSESYTYDFEGNLTSFTDKEGRITQYFYNSNNQRVKTIFPDGSNTNSQFDEAGNMILATDENGNATSFNYDANGNLILVSDALGNTTQYTFDANGNRKSQTDTNGNTTIFEYDALNQLISTIYPNGSSISSSFDSLGREVTRTDQLGNSIYFQYDELDRLIEVVDALGNSTSYEYDEVGNLIVQTDANGNSTQFEYDDLGRRIKRILPLGMFESQVYDPVGNILLKSDFNNFTIAYDYDVNNNLTLKTYPDGTTENYTYSPSGKLLTLSDNRGTTLFNYDLRNRLLQRTDPSGALISYTYDAVGNRTSVTIPTGTTTYTYDQLNRLLTVSDPIGNTTTYEYDSVGNQTRLIYPNGTITSYGYDNLNRLTDISHNLSDGSIISSFSYTLDLTGNRTRLIENSGRVVDYTYDANHRLIMENINEPNLGTYFISYAYDNVGNRLTENVNGIVNFYSFDVNDRLQDINGTILYTYDDNGNTLSQVSGSEAINYVYDFENQLIRANLSNPNSSSEINYVYDEDGLRIQKIIDDTIFIGYLFDKNLSFAQILLETESTSSSSTSYVYGNDLISQQSDSGSIFYYHHDAQMSTRQMTDNLGTVSNNYTFDAFGNLVSQVGTISNNYLYTGEQFDTDLSLYYLRHRYYDSSTGRFISQDEWEGNPTLPVSLHKYMYASNNPVNLSDPNGQFFLAFAIGIGVQQTLINSMPSATSATSFGTCDLVEFRSPFMRNLNFGTNWTPNKIIVHRDFLDQMRYIARQAGALDLLIHVTTDYRPVPTRTSETDRLAYNSNHMVGYAIDFNLQDIRAGQVNHALPQWRTQRWWGWSDLETEWRFRTFLDSRFPNRDHRIIEFLQGINTNGLRYGGNFNDYVHVEQNLYRQDTSKFWDIRNSLRFDIGCGLRSPIETISD